MIGTAIRNACRRQIFGTASPPSDRNTELFGGLARVVGAFPDRQSCLNLAAARLRYIPGSAWSAKRYMNMRPLYQLQNNQTDAVA